MFLTTAEMDEVYSERPGFKIYDDDGRFYLIATKIAFGQIMNRT